MVFICYFIFVLCFYNTVVLSPYKYKYIHIYIQHPSLLRILRNYKSPSGSVLRYYFHYNKLVGTAAIVIPYYWHTPAKSRTKSLSN